MKISRRYQTSPEQATCRRPGCSFHRNGPTAEALGEAHAEQTGHEVRVELTSTVIFSQQHSATVNA